MAARLEWKRRELFLTGKPKRVAEVRPSVVKRRGWVYEIFRGLAIHVSDPYESIADCRQDAEAEVRRLLKAAGVEVE